jgi:hypothetical protein
MSGSYTSSPLGACMAVAGQLYFALHFLSIKYILDIGEIYFM